MLTFPTTLSSTMVLLRPIEEEDLAAMKPLTGNPNMWTYFTSDLSNSSELEQWVTNAIADHADHKRLAFSILDQHTNQLIGSTSLGNISERDKRVEIGWTWIAEAFQGKGYNAHVKYLLLKHCFDTCGFVRVEFKTDVLNVPARKAMQKIGLTEEGVLRSHTQMTGNRRRDTVFYSVLADEWLAIKQRNGWE